MPDALAITPAALWANLWVLGQVLLIDLVLAGDNAVAVGMSASGLAPAQRRAAILAGLAAAVALRITFALLATRILAVIGLTLAGGLILLWVCWKMWRDLLLQARLHREAMEAGAPTFHKVHAKSFVGALVQIMLADLSMSLDNVLAVAGAARDHPAVLVFGLLLSIALTGMAASWIARFLTRARWLGYVGLLVVVWVALHMIWDGSRRLVVDTDHTAQYNAVMPGPLRITPEEAAAHKAHKD